MNMITLERKLRAQGYASGKKQLIKDLAALTAHLQNMPENKHMTADEMSRLQRAHMTLRDAANEVGLELPCLDI